MPTDPRSPPNRVPGQGLPVDPEGPSPDTETPPMRQPDPSRAAPTPPPVDPGPTSAYPHGSNAAATGAIGAGSGGSAAAVGSGSPQDEPPAVTSGSVGRPGEVVRAVLHGGQPASVTRGPDARAPTLDAAPGAGGPHDGAAEGRARSPDDEEADEDDDNPGSVRRRADPGAADDALGQAGTHPLGTAIGAIGGAVAGAVTGIAAGPLGSLAGAIGGAVAGGLLGSGAVGAPVVGPTVTRDEDGPPAEGAAAADDDRRVVAGTTVPPQGLGVDRRDDRDRTGEADRPDDPAAVRKGPPQGPSHRT